MSGAGTKAAHTVRRIEQNRERFGGKTFPCPCCRQAQAVKIDRRGKPYIGCDPCGVQLFVRLPQGIDHMAEWIEGGRKGPAPIAPPALRPAARPRTGADFLTGAR